MAVLLMAGPEPPGSARHATTLNRPAPEVSNWSPVPAHYGIYRNPIDTAAAFAEEGRSAMRTRAGMAREGGMQAVLRTTIERWFTPDTEARRPDLIDRVSKTLLADDPPVHAAMWDMISALDLVPQLHRITCPTLVLVGEFDPSSPPAAARVLRDNIAGAQMHVIPQASHMAPLEKPDAINAHLTRFLGIIG